MTAQKTMFLMLIALLVSSGQVLFKQASKSFGAAPGWSGVLRLAQNPVFITALAVYGVGTLLWVWGIRDVPLSRAYPIMGLVFVFVPLLGCLVLHEPLNWKVLGGGGVIIAGIVLSQL